MYKYSFAFKWHCKQNWVATEIEIIKNLNFQESVVKSFSQKSDFDEVLGSELWD